MKFQVMLRILFRLLKSRKVSAAALAKENDVSERSIRRYLEELIVCGVPLGHYTRQGAAEYACPTPIGCPKIF